MGRLRLLLLGPAGPWLALLLLSLALVVLSSGAGQVASPSPS